MRVAIVGAGSFENIAHLICQANFRNDVILINTDDKSSEQILEEVNSQTGLGFNHLPIDLPTFKITRPQAIDLNVPDAKQKSCKKGHSYIEIFNEDEGGAMQTTWICRCGRKLC
jgi:hypothetical protein